MADNTTINSGSGGDTIATDDLSTLNGGASSGVKVQRVKPGFGVDGDFTDVSTTNGLPIQSADLGAKADSAAGSDTGTFSLIALLKRLLGKFPAALGQSAASASLPVVLANEQINDLQITGQGGQTVVGQNIILATAGTSAVDAGQYRWISLQVVCAAGVTAGGQINFEGTNDPAGASSNWEPINLIDRANQVAAPVSNMGVAGAQVKTFFGPIFHRYLRARISTVIGGTGGVQAFTLLRMAAPVPTYQMVANPSSGNFFATISGSATVTGTVTANAGAGTALFGDVGIQYRANATGGATIGSVLSGATTAASSIKAGAGRLIGWQLHNGSAGVRSVKVFNTLVGGVTMGTTAAAFEIDIPAGGRSEVQLPGGIGMSTAIVYAVTSAKGLTDNTATGLAANDVSGSFFYA